MAAITKTLVWSLNAVEHVVADWRPTTSLHSLLAAKGPNTIPHTVAQVGEVSSIKHV